MGALWVDTVVFYDQVQIHCFYLSKTSERGQHGRLLSLGCIGFAVVCLILVSVTANPNPTLTKDDLSAYLRAKSNYWSDLEQARGHPVRLSMGTATATATDS